MLMVDGTLYMWVRNTGNATLAWSADHGQTWTWGFKFDTGFGCPTFLNFGRNYGGRGTSTSTPIRRTAPVRTSRTRASSCLRAQESPARAGGV